MKKSFDLQLTPAGTITIQDLSNYEKGKDTDKNNFARGFWTPNDDGEEFPTNLDIKNLS